MEHRVKTACVVTAAGRSERFGKEDKLLALLHGKPVLAHVLDALPRDAFSQLIAVTSSDAVSALCERKGVPFVQYGGGPLSETLRTGVSVISPDADGILFVNGDRPFLREESIRRLIRAFSRNPGRAARLSFRGTPSNPVLLPASLRKELIALDGERGGSSLLRSFPTVFVEAEDARELIDIDEIQTLAYYNSGECETKEV